MIDYQKISELFINYKTGIHFGGNVGDNRIFNFDAVPYKDQTVLYKAGVGMVSNRLNGTVQQVIVPLARR